MEPTEAKNTANEKLTHNKENTGKEAGTAPKEKIVLESGKNSSDKDKNGYKERLKEITAVLHKHAITRGVSPEKLRLILTDLGPTFIKLGQVMSMRSDILPKRYCDELMKLCSDVEPMPFSEVEEVLQEAFGCPWQEEFQEIQRKPLGSASIAQVHRAVLKTGEEVVVKVQRKGIYEVMARDIGLMKKAVKLLPPVSIKEAVDLNLVLEELWRVTQEEMNFLTEAANMEEFSRKNKNVAFVKTPILYREYTTASVLVMEYIDGIPIDDKETLLAGGYDLDEIGSKFVDNFIKQVMVDGFFHADPHPGNILVKDGKVIYIDLGIMGRLSVRDRGGFKRIVEAVGSKNSAELKDALITFSVAHDMNAIDHPRFLAELDNVLESYGSTDVADIDIGALLGDIMVLTRQCKVTLPASVTAVSRGIITMEGSLQDCLANANIVDIINGHLQRSKNIKTEIENQTRDLLISLNSATHSLIKAAEYSGDTLHMLSRGQLKVNMEMLSSPEPLYKVGRIMNRLAMSLVIAGLLVSGSLIIAVDMPRLFGMPVLSLVEHVSAFVLSVWLVWDMFRRTR